jgi:1-acyl-sn-glycerol-3-phosphate acyltransferase
VNTIIPVFRAAAFYGALALFGVWAAAFNLLSFLFAWLPAGERTERRFQRMIRPQVAAFFRCLAALRLLRIEYRGWERLDPAAGVIVANHPGLLDAFYLLARVPRAFCVFKPAIRRNPLLGAAARRAGYLASDSGVELVRRAVERIGRGATLVIFPEGTRTAADGTVGRLRPGFAAIARHAGVRVQLLRITTDRKLFAKGEPWWRLPSLPVNVTVEVGPSLDAAGAASTDALVAEVARELRGETTGGGLTGAERVRTLTAA